MIKMERRRKVGLYSACVVKNVLQAMCPVNVQAMCPVNVQAMCPVNVQVMCEKVSS
jgi:hypothetical protein